MASPLTLRAALALALALSPALGCDGEAGGLGDPEALDASDLDERFACADVTVVAATQDGEEAIFIGIEDGLAMQVAELGVPVEATYSLPDPRITVRRAVGSNVYQGLCGRDNGEPWRVDERQEGVSGELRVMLLPQADGVVRVQADLFDLALEPTEGGGGRFELAEAHLQGLALNGP